MELRYGQEVARIFEDAAFFIETKECRYCCTAIGLAGTNYKYVIAHEADRWFENLYKPEGSTYDGSWFGPSDEAGLKSRREERIAALKRAAKLAREA